MKRKSLRFREAQTGLAFAALPLAGFGIFYFIPFGITIFRTINSNGRFTGFMHYSNILGSEAFRLAAGNTLRFNGIGVPLLMAISFCIALLLNTRPKGADGFRSAYVLPLVLPSASVILVFQILFDVGGVFNFMLGKLGLNTVNFLSSGNVFFVLLLLYIWKNMGYCIILALAGLTQIPKELYEAAQADGAGIFTQTRKITLPLMAPTFFFMTLISIVGAFKSFREAFALAGDYPHESIYMLQHFMNNNFERLNYARLSVAAVLTFLVIFAFVLAIYLRRGQAGHGAGTD